jgi:hypothetical protein
MLGYLVAQFTVSEHVLNGPRVSSQEWQSFPQNQAGGIAVIDLFVVPTVAFDQF